MRLHRSRTPYSIHNVALVQSWFICPHASMWLLRPQFYFEREGLPFIDLAGLMRTFLPVGADASPFTTDLMHFGSIAYYHSTNVSLTLSSLTTQKLLEEICAER